MRAQKIIWLALLSLSISLSEIFAANIAGQGNTTYDDTDSVSVITYDIMEPTVSSIIPSSLMSMERINTEDKVLDNHLILSNSITAEAASVLKTGSRSLNQYAVGQIPLNSSISPTGGRIYSMPIHVASGWNSVPNVSLTYNSQHGNGAAGYGWDISGISSIELRNQNYYYDGINSHAEYDSNESVYSLDGVPIVRSSMNVEGFSHATARGNILIKMHHTSSGALSYFTVLYPDGSVGTFGYTDNSSYMTSYPLTKIEDINGNTITYNYSLWANHYYITSIEYGSDASIAFQYEYRSDTGHTKYRAGQSNSYPYRRINSITSNDGNDEICRYSFTYEYQDDVSLLKEINCSSGSVSYRPLTFTYGIDNVMSSDETFSLQEQNFFVKYFTQTDEIDIIYKRGKFITGECSDGIVMLPRYNTYTKIDSSGFLTKRYRYGSKYSKDQVILCNPSVQYATQFEIKAGEGFQLIESADIDGDGTDELVKINNESTTSGITDFKIYIYSFNLSGVASCDSLSLSISDGTENPKYTNPAKCFYYFGNFRGTGKSMLMIISRDKSRFALVDLDSKQKLNETTLFSMSDEISGLIISADFENDGQDDLCHITSDGMDVYSMHPVSGSTFTKRRTYTGISKSLLYYEPTVSVNGVPGQIQGSPYLTDLNGDGYLDVAYAPGLSLTIDGYTFNSPTWNISTFNGKSFTTQSLHLYTRLKDDSIAFMDVDKDGLPDMLQTQNSRLYLIPNVNGTFHHQSSYMNIIVDENAELIPCEISQHGVSGDIIAISGPLVKVYAFNTNHSTNRLITCFTDSFETRQYNTYRDISKDAGAYLTDHSRTYDYGSGFSRQRVPLQVIYGANTISSDGDIYVNEYYTYYDAVFNNRGIGFCGFGKVRSIDYISGHVVESEFYPEKMGVPTRISKSLQGSSTSPYEVTINTYDNHSTTYGKLSPRLSESEITDNVSGIVTTKSVVYDTYDYPTLSSTTRTSGDGVEHKETAVYSYEHNISESRYVLGIVKEQSLAKNNSGAGSTTSWKQKSVLTYDDHYRPLTRKDYVGENGFKYSQLNPIEPLPDTLIIQPKEGGNALISGDQPIIPPSATYYDATNLVSETVWEYDIYGNIISEMKAPYGASEFTGSTYAYDSSGRYLISATDPLGHTVTYSGYDKFGNPASVTDHHGRATSYTYDDWGNLLNTVHPDGTIEETSTEWGGLGLYTVTVNKTGEAGSIIHYDELGRAIRSGSQRYNNQWQYVDKEYDSRGRLKKESLPFRGNSATYWNVIEYDDYNRKTCLTEASGKVSTWIYDGTTVTSAQNGIVSIKTYDASGNLVSVTDDGGTITYSLRDDGQPTKVTAPGNVSTSFTYDVYGRRTKIVDPSAGTQTESIVFNSDGGSISTHTNPNGSIITYTDRFGRTTKIERPGEYTTEYVYNNNGLITSEVSSNGTSKAYTYDEFDRISTLTETVPDGKWLKKTYTYTSGSNVNTISYESQAGIIGTESFSYSYGNIVRIGMAHHNIRILAGENDLGQPTSVMTGSITRTYAYTPYGMPTGRTMGSVMDYSYSFDPLKGNLMSRTDNLRNQTETFGYDALNRLTVIDDREITYSDNGNITSIDSVGDMTYDNSAKPYQVTSLTLEDDVVPSRVQNVTYTCYSRPSIMTEGGRSAAFTYNGDGARVKMNVSDGATSVLSRYYIGNQYELDVTPNGTTERLYLGGDAYSAPAVYVKEGSGAWTFYNIGRDYLGNITHIATADGTLVEENSYDPWGRLRNPETKEIYSLGTEPELMLGRGYTGHEHLTWFGLINMNARLYDPVLGRFLSPDPFVQMPDFTQNFNRYSYCLNNPLVYVDKNGEILGWVLLGAAVVGGYNLWQNWDNAEGGWDKLAAFGAGAIGGAMIVAAGLTSGIATIALAGAGSGGLINYTNELIAQTGKNFEGIENVDKDKLTASTISGVVSGALTGIASTYFMVHPIVINGIKSPLFSSAVSSGIISGISHMSSSMVYDTCMGADFNEALNNSYNGFWKSVFTGAVLGATKTAATMLYKGYNPINGKKFVHDPKGLPYDCYVPKDMVENQYRQGDYGYIVDGRYQSVVRVDPPTPVNSKGPNEWHFHLNGNKEHIFDWSKWPWKL